MTKKFYFNGNYVVKGRKLFGKIYGVVVATNNHVFSKGEKVKMVSETFKEVDDKQVELLRDWGYFSKD
jgi:hypothetical protein